MNIKNLLLGLSFVATAANASDIIDFKNINTLEGWQVVNDGVMGGRSAGYLAKNADKQIVFSGNVSLKNNGGFTSIRYRPQHSISATNKQKVMIRLKGDGKDYQFRLKGSNNQRHSYVAHFSTNGDWQEIQIELSDMYPSFRGRRLDIGNFKHPQIAEMGFLIANKKAEDFKLVIDWIKLQ